jgi:branched-chain amino acid transport system permease protein
VVSIVCIYALLALSFDLLAHFVGLVSLGGAFFIGTGGYLAAILNTSLGLPPLLTIPIATLVGATLCTILLLPCLPLRGVYFAIVTLMYPLIFARVIEALNILGGTDGIVGVASFPNRWVEQYFMILMVLLFMFAMRRMVNLDVGLVFRGIKDNDQAVRASGISITYYKAVAVFIASAMGCLGGASLVHIYMWAGMSQFALDFSIIPIAATVIGGGGTLVGPVLGCFILVPISELLRAFGTLRIVFYALILVAFIVIRSEGIMVYGQRKYHQFERWVKV